MRTRNLLAALLHFAAAAALAGCGGIDTPDSTAESFELYSIDGRDEPGIKVPPGSELFRGFPVLGKLDVKDKKTREELIAAFKEGIARDNMGEAMCFLPRHAIRTTRDGRTIDYVICFECHKYRIHGGAKSAIVKTIDSFPLALFNEILQRAGVPLAPPPFEPQK